MNAEAMRRTGQVLSAKVDVIGWDEAIALALANRGEDAYGYRIEAVNLMRLAQSLSR